MNPVLCIYHANCADGFGAAWVVRAALPEATFHPGVYGETPPDVSGFDVVMVDFTYPRDTIIAMAEVANSVVIIDHHAPALAQLVDLPDNVNVVFDKEHSGAMLTWKYFFLENPAPPLIAHIEDRDLWRFDLPNTKEIMACVFSHPYDFDVWGRLMTDDPYWLKREGEVILRKHNKDIAEMLPAATRYLTIAGYVVPAANVPWMMASDVGHILCEDFPFSATYWDGDGVRHFSLRSRKGVGVDVADIARKFGGNGHINAAGFKVSFKKAAEFELNL